MRRSWVVVAWLPVLTACGGGNAPPVAHETPVVTATTQPSTPSATSTPSVTPTPTPSSTPRSTRTAAPRTATHTPSRQPPYIPPPPGSGTFVAPTLVSTALGGCDYLGENEWRIRFSVTVRGGQEWQFSNSAANMSFQFVHVGTAYGGGGTATGTFHHSVQWIAHSDGSGVPEEFDERVPWYAIRDEPTWTVTGVKLPAKHELVAHCER